MVFQRYVIFIQGTSRENIIQEDNFFINKQFVFLKKFTQEIIPQIFMFVHSLVFWKF